ncbi:hypothetical protein PN36_04260 [Candidatus Thiomargarita nelsonii]|uniref:Secreted protein n=1 Tax=Candidatus Thiomargarita nelsonii TaxID=1003181 RepID=A0A0A6P695_9GAMM|nr:hypothetical protein PN36_04260 [Candidatus Thiomargarita nelsonii]
MSNKKFWKPCLGLVGLLLLTTAAMAKNLIYTPDDRIIHIKGGVTQPDLSNYRSPLESGSLVG